MRQIFIVLFMFLTAVFGKEYSSNHQWVFAGGNLVGNWSFEEYSPELCSDGSSLDGTNPLLFAYDCRYKIANVAGTPEPHSGNYVLEVETKNSGAFDQRGPLSEQITIEPGIQYELSFYFFVNWANTSASNAPTINFFDNFGSSIGPVSGFNTYESQSPSGGEWVKYTHIFSSPANAATITLSLINSASTTGNEGNAFFFDDVMIRKMTGDVFETVEQRGYGDAFGVLDHTIRYDGLVNVVRKFEYDDERRINREYMPIRFTKDRIEDVLISALNLSPEDIPDYADVQTAYTTLTTVVGGFPKIALPSEIIMNVVVATAGNLAPITSTVLNMVPFTSADGFSIPIQLNGIIRNSTEYNDLVERRNNQVVSELRGPFEYQGSFEDIVKTEYPGENNVDFEFAYPVPGLNTIFKSALPGDEYELNDPGEHFNSSGTAFLVSGDLPSDPEFNPGTTGASVVAEYNYSWLKNRMGNYTAMVKDPQNRVLISAFSETPFPVDENDWAISTNEYDDFGRLISEISPEGLNTTFEYNGMGELTKDIDPDRGTKEYLYNKRGDLRFILTSEGDLKNYVVFFQYDNIQRLIGQGVVSKTDFIQVNADDNSFPGVGSFSKGFIYDEISETSFLAATNVSLSALGFDPSVLKFGQGGLVASYHRNPESTGPGIITDADKLVATFFSYDDQGRLNEIFRYLGPASVGKKWHRILYEFDDLDRVLVKTVFTSMGNVIATRSTFVYDNKGNVVSILDKNNQEQIQYFYNFRDELVSVNLFNKINILRKYDIQGKPISNRAIAKTGVETDIYSEYIGYEDKPNSQLNSALPNSAKRFDSKVSSVLRKFSSLAGNRLEWDRYNYSPTEYLQSEETLLPSSLNHFNSDGSVNFGSLTFPTLPSSTKSFLYDNDLRLRSQSENSTSYTYNYKSGTHQLDNIFPDITNRSTSGVGNFSYDDDGNLIEDNGYGKSIFYSVDGQPKLIQLSGKNYHFFYNEDGFRVATLEENTSGALDSRKSYVYESNLSILKEIEEVSGSVTVKNNILGVNEVIGFEIESTGEKVYQIKDYLSSVINNISVSTDMIISERGYSTYGSAENRVVPSSSISSESFTTKEFREDFGTYNFGARGYDPQIGVWLSADPGFQYWNPYSYTGGDPVNRIDPDGLRDGCVTCASLAKVTSQQRSQANAETISALTTSVGFLIPVAKFGKAVKGVKLLSKTAALLTATDVTLAINNFIDVANDPNSTEAEIDGALKMLGLKIALITGDIITGGILDDNAFNALQLQVARLARGEVIKNLLSDKKRNISKLKSKAISLEKAKGRAKSKANEAKLELEKLEKEASILEKLTNQKQQINNRPGNQGQEAATTPPVVTSPSNGTSAVTVDFGGRTETSRGSCESGCPNSDNE